MTNSSDAHYTIASDTVLSTAAVTLAENHQHHLGTCRFHFTVPVYELRVTPCDARSPVLSTRGSSSPQTLNILLTYTLCYTGTLSGT